MPRPALEVTMPMFVRDETVRLPGQALPHATGNNIRK